MTSIDAVIVFTRSGFKTSDQVSRLNAGLHI
jgi:hypothetical protein